MDTAGMQQQGCSSLMLTCQLHTRSAPVRAMQNCLACMLLCTVFLMHKCGHRCMPRQQSVHAGTQSCLPTTTKTPVYNTAESTEQR